MRRSLNVLISGAGVAGPALACRLTAAGCAVTVVESAPGVRRGGFAVDFRGPTHLSALDALGVLDDLRAVRTHGAAMAFVDAADREIFRLPASFAGGDLEVLRADLTRLLISRSAGATYRFGDRITSLRESPSSVAVTFDSGDSAAYDLVVGADGIHSGVRRLAFGPPGRHVRHLGHHIAGWSLPAPAGLVPGESRQFAVPGRMAGVGLHGDDPSRATAMVVFAGPRGTAPPAELIGSTYRDLGWHVPALLAALPAAGDLYFDSISRVRVPRWTTGRIALLGDAAWGVTLGGMGVGTGIVGAHVLAGELTASPADIGGALRAYETHMRRYAGRWQRGANPGAFLAPVTPWGLRLRNTVFRSGLVRRALVGGTKSLATDQALPEYA